jgi:hypothetical protein
MRQAGGQVKDDLRVPGGDKEPRFSSQFPVARMFGVVFVSLNKGKVEQLSQGTGPASGTPNPTTHTKYKRSVLVLGAATGVAVMALVRVRYRTEQSLVFLPVVS